METAQRLVNAATELAGLPILDDSATVAYKVRRGPAPSKTEGIQAVLHEEPGRELFPLFVGANDAIHTGLARRDGRAICGRIKTGKPRSNQNLVTCPSGRDGTQATCLLLAHRS